MLKTERILNGLLGLSVLGWAVMGLVDADPEARFTAVRLSISALSLCVGLLFLCRRAAQQEGSIGLIAVCLPSLLIGGWALKLAPQPQLWPWYAQGAFVIGILWTISGLLTLGRSFAVLPALRKVVVNGPFRVIRHPIYAGEIVLALACYIAEPGLLSVAPLVAALPLVVVRIIAEERLLMTCSTYLAYAQQVRWRLLPSVW
jgi:protein-S-isoprenylcysteine O-methyltransferase Ste14